MSSITALGTSNPPHRFRQQQIADFMVRAMQLTSYDSRRLHAIFNASGIDYRYSVLEDYGREAGFSFYANSEDFEPFPSTAERLAVFRACALELSTRAVGQMCQSIPDYDAGRISHLIVVCCTGMYAPGLDIDLVRTLGLPSTVQRTAINFMGCYAAFNAIKLADAICTSDESAKVLIVCTELCSLHFQKAATDDNLLANALFADGAAAMLVEGRTTAPLSLNLEGFCSELALVGSDDMAWEIGDLGFEMKLSTYVPSIIRGGIRSLTTTLLNKVGVPFPDVRYFAIHPGGKKILECVEEELGISKLQNKASYDVLRNYGNMSSPTVLFVLQEIMKKLTLTDRGERVLCFAFGPGLTLESMLLRIVTQ